MIKSMWRHSITFWMRFLHAIAIKASLRNPLACGNGVVRGENGIGGTSTTTAEGVDVPKPRKLAQEPILSRSGQLRDIQNELCVNVLRWNMCMLVLMMCWNYYLLAPRSSCSLGDRYRIQQLSLFRA